MLRDRVSPLLLVAMLWAGCWSTGAVAAEGWWGRLWRPFSSAPHVSTVVGSGQPGDPAYGHAMGVPTYAYGYFGAQTRPHEMWHKDYHSDFRQTFTPARH